ncbi:MAG: leucine-rich repeat protein [Clostridia bacterium]|nr:leucine-rich repeat protein [Clostridia bacterium]
MKKIISFFALTLVFVIALSLFSCAPTIAEPTSLNFDEETQTLRWGKVPGAYSYDVRIDGSEAVKNTKANQISLEYLNAGEHLIEVRTLPRDQAEEPSAWVSYKLFKPEETGLRYKLINNRTEYELVGAGTAEGDVVMESVYRGKPVTSIAAKAFANNNRITSIVVGEHVKTIADHAFVKCSSLTSVTLPEGLTSVGEYAFQSCKNLKTVNIPKSMTEIAPYLFSWCSSLETVKIEGSVASVGEYAFSNCSALTSVSFGDSLKKIGEYAFSDCTAMTSADLGASVESIDMFAFYNCHALSELELGEKLLTIGDSAFSNCTALTELSLPETLVDIGMKAFYGSTAIETVTVGDSLRRIGNEAFSGTKIANDAGDIFYLGNWVVVCNNKNITSIELKDGVYGIADYAFSYCTKIERISLSGIKYVGYASFGGCSELWEVAFDNALISLGKYAFASCPKLTDVYLGDVTETIGDYAFFECSSLFNMKLPSTVREIGANAFHSTRAHAAAADVIYIGDKDNTWAVGIKNSLFRGMTIKEGTKGIANYCFYNCLILGAISMPDTVEYIGRAAFYENIHVTYINISTSTKYIGDYAFYNCGGCWFSEDGTTVIPEGVEYIGRSAFYKCGSMVGVHIPSSVREIGPYAFFGCENLGESELFADEAMTIPIVGSVIIENGVTTIGDRAFQGCIRLAEIVIPDSVTSLGNRVFYKCENLKKVTIGGGITDIPDYCFYKCPLLEEVIIADGVKTIGDYAFRGCEALKKVTLGKNITSIGKYAFYGCALESIILPDGCTAIGNYAFRGCSDVAAIVIPGSVESIGRHAFYGCTKATVYCEADSIPAYWNERWNSSYRPVIWGCTLSEDGTYPVSVKIAQGSPSNISAPDAAFAPCREGYTFLGWATSADSSEIAYTATDLTKAPVGTVLYSVWEPVATTN